MDSEALSPESLGFEPLVAPPVRDGLPSSLDLPRIGRFALETGLDVALRRYDPAADGKYLRHCYLTDTYRHQESFARDVIESLPRDRFSPDQVEFLNKALIGSRDCRITRQVHQQGRGRIADWLFRQAEILVACSVDDPWLIYGFAIFERTGAALALHYVYVKATYRRGGLGSRLVAIAANRRGVIVASHRTRGWDGLATRLRHSGYQLAFNPYLALPAPPSTEQESHQ